MQRIYLCSLLLIAVLLVSGCKKGEDDPAVSLLTRKARVTGKWRMVKGNLVIGTTDVTAFERYNEVYTFNGANYELTYTSAGIMPAYSSGTYRLNAEFDKKGNFSMTEYLSSKKLSATGSWDFNNGTGDAKKKERLVITINNVTSGKSGGYFFFDQSAVTFIYKIKELRNKKMVLTVEKPVYIDLTGVTQTFYGEYTFIQ